MMRILAALFVWFGSTLAFAQAPLNGAVALGPLASKSYLLVDMLSQQVLAAKNPDERVEPASLTKLMTAYVVFDALRQKRATRSQPVTISEKAWRAPGSRMFLDPGKSVAIEDLLQGMIVQSGNDASIALAEGIGGSEGAFVEQMNHEAARLGLRNSNFVNATGLPNPQQYSTAADLVLVSAAIIREFPQYFPMYRLREFRYNNITQYNRNRLLGRDPYVDGLKTGYTESAGFCMIATALRNRRRLIAVVIDADCGGKPVLREVRRRFGRRPRGGSAEAPQLWIRGLRHRAALRQGAAGASVAGMERQQRTVAGGVKRRLLRHHSEGVCRSPEGPAGEHATADRPDPRGG